MGIRERKERQKQELRAGILSAAREIASDSGWQSVTIRRIAEKIEYSPPTIYMHFDSKEDLLLELVRQGYVEQSRMLEAARSSSSSPEESLTRIVHAWLRFAVESPDLYQAMYGLGGVSFPIAELRAEGEKIGRIVAESIADLSENGEANASEVQDRVMILWSTAHGLTALAMADRLEDREEEPARLLDKALQDLLTAWKEN